MCLRDVTAQALYEITELHRSCSGMKSWGRETVGGGINKNVFFPSKFAKKIMRENAKLRMAENNWLVRMSAQSMDELFYI